MSGGVDVRPVDGRADLERFLRLPWRIYAADPLWVPPLLADVRDALNPAKHPFHQCAEVATFLARRGSLPVGRIAAVVNRAHNEFHQDSIGFIGLFEAIDDQGVADALFVAASEWLRERGMTSVQGPMNLSSNEEICSPGVLVDGWHRQPVVMMGHSPPYYGRLFERAGFVKAKDLLAYWLECPEPPPRLKRAYDRVLRDESIRIRSVHMRTFDEELAIIQSIYNSAWERNWGFVPMNDAEIQYLARQLKPIVNPRICAIAEVDGEPVGFALGLPDFNMALRHVNGRLFPLGLIKLLWHRRNIDTARTLTLGVRPGFRNRGLDAALVAHINLEANAVGIWRSECSWILEDNWEMRRMLERVGGVADKTYRIYEKPLS
ncbi:GNAT family N-acetyltransferase [soil metagenome]